MPEKRHFAATITAVAGCSPVTLRAWRNRNGFLPATQGGSGWNLFSVSEIAATRVVVVLTKLGIEAQVAVDAASRCLPVLDDIYSGMERGDLAKRMKDGTFVLKEIAVVDVYPKPAAGEAAGPGIVFVPGGENLIGALQRVAFGAAIVVDLVEIVGHVNRELRQGDYPAMMTQEEVRSMVVGTMDKVFSPRKGDDAPSKGGAKRKPAAPRSGKRGMK